MEMIYRRHEYFSFSEVAILRFFVLWCVLSVHVVSGVLAPDEADPFERDSGGTDTAFARD
jgi:cytochrome b